MASFCAKQFTATQWHTAADKAKWANDMAAWVQRGFPEARWRRGLYHHLATYLYSHIAHYTMHGFYARWFATPYKQLEWMEYVLRGGASGIYGAPTDTWCDVERAFQLWLRQSGLVEKQRQLCADLTEKGERDQLAILKAKYESEG